MLKVIPFSVLVLATVSIQSAFGASPEEIRAVSPQSPYTLVEPVAEEADVEIRTSGAHFFKEALTSTKPQTTTSEKFIPLLGAKTTVYVKPGLDVLVNVAFTAESRCNEPDSSASNWCEVRILVDGVEAAPAASSFPPDTYAFDSTDSGTEGVGSWESHAMDRHQCVFNANGTTVKPVPIEVQWKVTNFDGAIPPNFWLDDWSLTVELAKGCRQKAVKF